MGAPMDFLAQPELSRTAALAALEAHYMGGIAQAEDDSIKEMLRLEFALSKAVADFMDRAHGKVSAEVAMQCIGAAMARASTHIIASCDTPETRETMAGLFNRGNSADNYRCGASFLIKYAFEQNLADTIRHWDDGQTINIAERK